MAKLLCLFEHWRWCEQQTNRCLSSFLISAFGVLLWNVLKLFLRPMEILVMESYKRFLHAKYLFHKIAKWFLQNLFDQSKSIGRCSSRLLSEGCGKVMLSIFCVSVHRVSLSHDTLGSYSVIQCDRWHPPPTPTHTHKGPARKNPPIQLLASFPLLSGGGGGDRIRMRSVFFIFIPFIKELSHSRWDQLTSCYTYLTKDTLWTKKAASNFSFPPAL